MSSTNAPYGFRAARHPSGMVRSNPYTVASAYAANIFKGDPVRLVTAGTIELGTADGTRTGALTQDLIGVFAGCEYTDAQGKRVVSPFWPGGQVATEIVAYVWDDPMTEFEVQSDGTLASSAVGDQANTSNLNTNLYGVAGGSTLTGLSSATLGTLVGAGVQGQFRITEIYPAVDNAWGDSHVLVRVQIARHAYVTAKTAI